MIEKLIITSQIAEELKKIAEGVEKMVRALPSKGLKP
jgi:hypothetical protein